MSVSTSTFGTQQTGAAGTSMTYNGLTVPSGSTNPAIIFGFSLYASGGVAASGISATWDFGGTNQAMDFIGTAPIAGGVDYCGLFGLVNPAPGNLTLHMAWTNTCVPNGCANHVTGVDQTGGSTTWRNFGTNALTSATPSFNMGATYNSGAGSNTSLLYATCIIQLSTLSSVSGASWYTASNFQASPVRSAGGMYALPSATPTTMTWTLAGSAATAMAGIEIKPAAIPGSAALAGQSPEVTRLAKAGMPRGLAGMPPLITASLPIIVIPPPPAGGSTLPMMGVG
ncbi:MAG: hypothetical protein HRJ53_09280 [Acidobacteria bacterium Pan2503]|uniref:Uncharacterized protein n=1 Tax=Candidatus Acidiferrum panamense TaxID=2741543 RepID=A0A7V8NPW9_9BACT|nr:hypothetical protein [Candidatus Acidoferrum panamensis]